MVDSGSEDEWNHVSYEKKLQNQESRAAEYLTEATVYLAAAGERRQRRPRRKLTEPLSPDDAPCAPSVGSSREPTREATGEKHHSNHQHPPCDAEDASCTARWCESSTCSSGRAR